jgi:hypothetical protein
MALDNQRYSTIFDIIGTREKTELVENLEGLEKENIVLLSIR